MCHLNSGHMPSLAHMLQSWEKKLAHPMQFITAVIMLTTEIEMWYGIFNRKHRFSLFSYSFPTSINVGRSDKGSGNMTQINIALGMRGHFFLLNQIQVSQHFFMIVEVSNSYSKAMGLCNCLRQRLYQFE